MAIAENVLVEKHCVRLFYPSVDVSYDRTSYTLNDIWVSIHKPYDYDLSVTVSPNCVHPNIGGDCYCCLEEWDATIVRLLRSAEYGALYHVIYDYLANPYADGGYWRPSKRIAQSYTNKIFNTCIICNSIINTNSCITINPYGLGICTYCKRRSLQINHQTLRSVTSLKKCSYCHSIHYRFKSCQCGNGRTNT